MIKTICDVCGGDKDVQTYRLLLGTPYRGDINSVDNLMGISEGDLCAECRKGIAPNAFLMEREYRYSDYTNAANGLQIMATLLCDALKKSGERMRMG